MQITWDKDKHSLTIPEVFKEDAGNYVVRATNAAGSAKCYASMLIKSISESHMMKTRLVESSHSISRLANILPGQSAPEFIKLFGDTRVKPGQPCTLEVVVSGQPEPTVKWLFNSHEIADNSPYQVRKTAGGLHSLHIPEVHVSDAGRFSISADNQVGLATCSALLVVVEDTQLRPSSPPDTPVVKTHKIVSNIPLVPSPTFQSHLSRPPSLKPVEMVIEMPAAPQFTVPLKNLTVDEDTQITFDVKVTGNPEPEITWFKDGILLHHSLSHHITYSDGVVRLFIPQAKQSDTGKYVCVATNLGGRAQNSADLTVKGAKLHHFIN